MELSINPETAERIAWGACGVLSFIALIAWCRWRGTPLDQEMSLRRCRKEKDDAKKRSRLRSIGRLRSAFDDFGTAIDGALKREDFPTQYIFSSLRMGPKSLW
jgi:hypothetical protein